MRTRPLLSLTIAVASWLGAARAADAIEAKPVRVMQHSAELTLFVRDQDAVIDQLAAAARGAGGYLKERGNGRLVVRVPAARLDAFVQAAAAAGTLGQRRLETRDVTEQRERLTAGLASRETMLREYLTSMGRTASREDLMAIQGATVTLVGEIESAKGALRLMEHDARYAKVDVSFQMRDRTPVRVSRENNFKWLGEVDVNGLLADFAEVPQ